MRKIILLLVVTLPLISLGQNDVEKKITKYEQFTSKTGRISKFIDVKMPSIPFTLFGSVPTKIRTVIGEQSNFYFYIVEEKTPGGVVAIIEYSDLVEINKALTKLVSEVEADCTANHDYLENRFITEDGLQIGYSVSKGNASWYLKNDGLLNNTIYVKNAEVLTSNFASAQKKIEEMKASNSL